MPEVASQQGQLPGPRIVDVGSDVEKILPEPP